MSWSRYEGRASAERSLTGAARDAELEDFIRLQNSRLTDVRLEQATAIDGHEAGPSPDRQWYSVIYLADDGEGHPTEK